ncbi:AP-1 complex subunit sigma-2 isoform X1 [Vespula squamosa]|uniref:AP-1 complex subunit sigma-2 isoform X1 n=1 Tax=Vespula squamosa TaxID=30214 RepID=A0ABD2AZ91_VESSQ
MPKMNNPDEQLHQKTHLENNIVQYEDWKVILMIYNCGNNISYEELFINFGGISAEEERKKERKEYIISNNINFQCETRTSNTNRASPFLRLVIWKFFRMFIQWWFVVYRFLFINKFNDNVCEVPYSMLKKKGSVHHLKLHQEDNLSQSRKKPHKDFSKITDWDNIFPRVLFSFQLARHSIGMCYHSRTLIALINNTRKSPKNLVDVIFIIYNIKVINNFNKRYIDCSVGPWKYTVGDRIDEFIFKAIVIECIIFVNYVFQYILQVEYSVLTNLSNKKEGK